MYDDIAPGDAIPADAAMVAGYVDGLYRWAQADWDRFPNAVKVRIACFAKTDDGHVIDIEWGNSTPPEVPAWLVKRRAAGVDPTVYCSASIVSQIKDACQAAGVAEPHWWVACYDGNPSLTAACYGYQIDGVIAKQYADSTMSGGHYDLSVVADDWPGVDSTGGSTVGLVIHNVGSLDGVKIVVPAGVGAFRIDEAGQPEYRAIDPGSYSGVEIGDATGLYAEQVYGISVANDLWYVKAAEVSRIDPPATLAAPAPDCSAIQAQLDKANAKLAAVKQAVA